MVKRSSFVAHPSARMSAAARTRVHGRWICICAGAALLLAGGAPARAEWMQRDEAIMGTRITVQLRADDAAKGSAAIDAVMAEMRRIDALMSHYKPDSELSQINQHAAEAPVPVDRELFDLLKLSLHFSEITDGAFDITYAGVGHLYDYRRHIRPTEAEIRAALPTVNWRNLILDSDKLTVKFAMPGMRIDVAAMSEIARASAFQPIVSAGSEGRK